MVAFIDAHRGTYGVEPICAVLPIASSTYHEQRRRQADPTRQPARAQRDAISGALLAVAMVASAAVALTLRDRLSVVGTHAQFTRGFGLTDFSAGPVQPSARLMGSILVLGLMGTVARVIWGRGRG